MTRRCHHEFTTKADYPDDIICMKCQTIWTLTDYQGCTAQQMLTLPSFIRGLIMERQTALLLAQMTPEEYRSQVIDLDGELIETKEEYDERKKIWLKGCPHSNIHIVSRGNNTTDVVKVCQDCGRIVG